MQNNFITNTSFAEVLISILFTYDKSRILRELKEDYL